MDVWSDWSPVTGTDNGDNGGILEWSRIVIGNDEDEDVGAGLQECRGPTIDTRIWITSGKQLYYDCTAEPRCGR